jgi:hypothetical protein
VKRFSCGLGGKLSQCNDSLWSGRPEDRIADGGERFSAYIQIDPGPSQSPITVVMGSFPGVTWPNRDVNHSHPSSSEVKEIVEVYLYTSSVPSWQVRSRSLPLYFTFIFFFLY